MKPPRWIDEEAVFEHLNWRLKELAIWVIPELDYTDDDRPILPAENTEEIEAAFNLCQAEIAADPEFFPPDTEGEAVEAFLCGNTKLIGDLLPRRGADGTLINTKRYKRLRPETMALIGEILRGERNPKTGREKGWRNPETGKVSNRGRPKKTVAKKLEDTKTHIAYSVFLLAQLILHRWFPEKTSTDIRDRAQLFAALRYDIEVQTLDNYSSRKRTDRRRLPGV